MDVIYNLKDNVLAFTIVGRSVTATMRVKKYDDYVDTLLNCVSSGLWSVRHDMTSGNDS